MYVLLYLIIIGIVFFWFNYRKKAKTPSEEFDEQVKRNYVKNKNDETAFKKQLVGDLVDHFGKITKTDSSDNSPNTHLKYFFNNKVGYFSQAKTLEDAIFISRLVAPDGVYPKWTEFRNKVLDRIPDYDTDILKKENQTFITMAMQYSQWLQIQKDKDVLPYLEYDAVKDSVTCSTCKKLHGIKRRVDDDFWNIYFPPNCDECRCIVLQSDEVRKETDLSKKKLKLPDSKFAINVGKHELKLPY